MTDVLDHYEGYEYIPGIPSELTLKRLSRDAENFFTEKGFKRVGTLNLPDREGVDETVYIDGFHGVPYENAYSSGVAYFLIVRTLHPSLQNQGGPRYIDFATALKSNPDGSQAPRLKTRVSIISDRLRKGMRNIFDQ